MHSLPAKCWPGLSVIGVSSSIGSIKGRASRGSSLDWCEAVDGGHHLARDQALGGHVARKSTRRRKESGIHVLRDGSVPCECPPVFRERRARYSWADLARDTSRPTRQDKQLVSRSGDCL